MSAARWHHIWDLADERCFVSPVELSRLSKSYLADDRLLALFLTRRQIDHYGPTTQYVESARACVTDPDPACRFMAMLVLAELVPWYPNVAWTVIRTHAESADDDTRQLATDLLLKHLLKHHGERYQGEVDAWTTRSQAFARNYALRLMSAGR